MCAATRAARAVTVTRGARQRNSRNLSFGCVAVLEPGVPRLLLVRHAGRAAPSTVGRTRGLGNVVGLIVPGRRTGRRIVVLLGLLEVGGERYIGHPNGQVNWTRNLDTAGGATLVLTRRRPVKIQVDLLPPGEERDRAIEATWSQHVFPGNVIYWLARRHIFAVGRYYRIRPEGEPVPATDRTSSP